MGYIKQMMEGFSKVISDIRILIMIFGIIIGWFLHVMYRFWFLQLAIPILFFIGITYYDYKVKGA